MDGPQELTDIQRFYKNSTVFLTGATGFIGKLLLEKILRALPVKKVYILIRTKNNVPPTKRFQEIFESPVFERVKRTYPDALQKVFIMEGDCSVPQLGMSEANRKIFVEEVNAIFHAAASIKLDEHIRKATFTNVRGTKDLITLAKQIKKLKVLVYIGTSCSNCIRTEVEEKIYPSKITAEKLIAACENLDDECLSRVTNTLIGEWPNTYTFSKQVTEDYIKREGQGLPICITRPAIVISTVKEPIAAFVDNAFTIASFLLANGLGFNRINYLKNINVDAVPADFVVNESIAAGWQTGESFRPNRTKEVLVYHVSSGVDNPLSMDALIDFTRYYSPQAATKHLVAYPLHFATSCRYNYLFCRTLFDTVQAHIIDIFHKISGKEPMVATMVAKFHSVQTAYEPFITKPIFLHVENTHKMLRKMTFQERELFNFDVTTINWDNYFSQYFKGLRCYVLKDPLDTLPEGIQRYKYLRNIFIVTGIIIIILLYAVGKFLLFKVVPIVFSIILYALRGNIC